MTETACDVGIAGLGSIGCSLALTIANHGYSVAAYDRNEMALGALRLKTEGRSIEAARSLSELVSVLRVPRTVMILLQSERHNAINIVISNLQNMIRLAQLRCIYSI